MFESCRLEARVYTAMMLFLLMSKEVEMRNWRRRSWCSKRNEAVFQDWKRGVLINDFPCLGMCVCSGAINRICYFSSRSGPRPSSAHFFSADTVTRLEDVWSTSDHSCELPLTTTTATTRVDACLARFGTDIVLEVKNATLFFILCNVLHNFFLESSFITFFVVVVSSIFVGVARRRCCRWKTRDRIPNSPSESFLKCVSDERKMIFERWSGGARFIFFFSLHEGGQQMIVKIECSSSNVLKS